MRDSWLYAVTVLSSLLIGRGSVPVFPDYWPGGSAVMPVGEGPAWEAFECYRLGMSETWSEAADRIDSFRDQPEAVAFVESAAEKHRQKCFGDTLGVIENKRMFDGDEWSPSETAKLWREFAQQAGGNDGID